MAHKAQQDFIREVKLRLPKYFTGVNVLDCGSLDINGNNREFFDDSRYIGLDIIPGRNVDIVCPAHKYHEYGFDVVISTEMLEHDKFWKKSLENIYLMVRDNGLIILTAATTGREPHGIPGHHPKDSPATHNYYLNITKEMLVSVFSPGMFNIYQLFINHTDIYFYGIKNNLCRCIW